MSLLRLEPVEIPSKWEDRGELGLKAQAERKFWLIKDMCSKVMRRSQSIKKWNLWESIAYENVKFKKQRLDSLYDIQIVVFSFYESE